MALLERLTACACLALAACAQRSGPSRANCGVAQADSFLVAGAPLYRDCGVDERARLLTPAIRVVFAGDGSGTCVSAQVRFVVDTLGMVELDGARVLRTNDVAFAEALVRSLARWRYSPAMLGGRPVRQLVTEGRTSAQTSREAANSPRRRATTC